MKLNNNRNNNRNRWLRFIDTDAPSGGGADNAKDTQGAADAETAQTTDWEAEARKWKDLSRKNEARAKDNAEKARLYDKAQEEGKSELQKALDAAQKAESRAAALEAQVLCAKVAAPKGVDAELMAGSPQEEQEESADKLLAWRGDKTPKAPPSSDAGDRGTQIKGASQLTREDLRSMSPAEIVKANKDGRLNELKGIVPD